MYAVTTFFNRSELFLGNMSSCPSVTSCCDKKVHRGENGGKKAEDRMTKGTFGVSTSFNGSELFSDNMSSSPSLINF